MSTSEMWSETDWMRNLRSSGTSETSDRSDSIDSTLGRYWRREEERSSTTWSGESDVSSVDVDWVSSEVSSKPERRSARSVV
jgi:hypothetical protein